MSRHLCHIVSILSERKKSRVSREGLARLLSLGLVVCGFSESPREKQLHY